MRFLLDNNLSPRLARGLAGLCGEEHQVVAERDKFPPNTEDRAWIGSLAAERDWVIVSGDRRITRNAVERTAWLSSGMTFFFLDKAWLALPFWEQAAKLVKWWPDIVRQAQTVERGSSFLVPVSGHRMKVLAG